MTVLADGAFQERAESLRLQPALVSILWVLGSPNKIWRCKTLFVGFMEYNRISGKGEEGNSGFGRCIYKSMKPKSLRFAKAEN